MSNPIPFTRPAPQLNYSRPSSDSNAPSLSANDSERLKTLITRIVALGATNPFAASLVLDMSSTVLKFFDA